MEEKECVGTEIASILSRIRLLVAQEKSAFKYTVYNPNSIKRKGSYLNVLESVTSIATNTADLFMQSPVWSMSSSPSSSSSGFCWSLLTIMLRLISLTRVFNSSKVDFFCVHPLLRQSARRIILIQSTKNVTLDSDSFGCYAGSVKLG